MRTDATRTALRRVILRVGKTIRISPGESVRSARILRAVLEILSDTFFLELVVATIARRPRFHVEPKVRIVPSPLVTVANSWASSGARAAIVAYL